MTPPLFPDREHMAAITARVAKRYGVTVDDLRNGYASRQATAQLRRAV